MNQLSQARRIDSRLRVCCRSLIRFRLRHLFAFITVLSLYLGMWKSQQLQQCSAFDALIDKGAGAWDGVVDPIGPNWIYHHRGGLIGNGNLPSWFERTFCIQSSSIMVLEGKQFDNSDLEKLLALRYVDTVTLKNTSIGVRQMSRLVESGARAFGLIDSRLTDSNLNYIQLSESCEILGIASANVSPEGLRKLAERHPECLIERIDD